MLDLLIKGITKTTGTMSQHPIGAVLEIFGTETSEFGSVCEDHEICGKILEEDMIVRLKKRIIQIGKSLSSRSVNLFNSVFLKLFFVL